MGVWPRPRLASDQLRKGAKVVATTDLRDVPEGTKGKVILVNGLHLDPLLGAVRQRRRRWAPSTATSSPPSRSWQRPAQRRRASRCGRASDDGGGDEAAADEDDGGGVTTPNGTFVSQKHIDRAKAARARLTGG